MSQWVKTQWEFHQNFTNIERFMMSFSVCLYRTVVLRFKIQVLFILNFIIEIIIYFYFTGLTAPYWLIQLFFFKSSMLTSHDSYVNILNITYWQSFTGLEGVRPLECLHHCNTNTSCVTVAPPVYWLTFCLKRSLSPTSLPSWTAQSHRGLDGGCVRDHHVLQL